jgi:hypothetical protein
MNAHRDVKPHLLALLDDWMSSPRKLPDPRLPKGATRKIPVFYSQSAIEQIKAEKGTIVPYVEEPVPDYRLMEESHYQDRLRELRRALEANDDPYWIAWVALEIGAGSVLPESIIGRRLRESADNARRRRAEENRDSLPKRNARIRQLVQSFHERHKRRSFTNACNEVGQDQHLTGKQVQRICADMKW